MIFKSTEHHIAERGQHLPPVDESLMLDYVMGGNGTFARGRRPGMEVCMPIAPALIRGLAPVPAYVQWGYPKIQAAQVELILSISRHVAKTVPREALFHLSFDRAAHGQYVHGHVSCMNGWHVEFPEQHATPDKVKPLQQGTGTSEDRAVVEIHSHHRDPAYFSPKDDKDEGGMSFRVYGVLGTIFEKPTIRMRVGLFGHFFEYPASEFLELPVGLIDGVTENRQ
jgi:hypothetical protein